MFSNFFCITSDIVDELLSVLGQEDAYWVRPKGEKEFLWNLYQLFIRDLVINIIISSSAAININKRKQLELYYSKYHHVWINAYNNVQHFEEISPCEMKNILNNYIEWRLDSIINNNDQGCFDRYLILYLNHLNLPVCVEHDSCLKYISNSKILINIVCNKISLVEAEREILSFKSAERTDKILGWLCTTKNPKFNIVEKYHQCGKEMVYFDTNVFINLEEEHENKKAKEIWGNILEESKANFDYYYSPAHLEDIQKRKNNVSSKRQIISEIDTITNSLFIHRVNDGVRFDYEAIEFCDCRVSNKASLEVTDSIEKNRVDFRKILSLDYPEYNDNEHITTINNKDLFGKDIDVLKRVLRKMNSQINMDEIHNIKIYELTYSQINSIINDLVNALDILHYYSDKIRIKGKIISSVHDIEHLIYATFANIFVTDDKRLRKRAKVIFAYILPAIKVMSSEEFRKYLINAKT